MPLQWLRSELSYVLEMVAELAGQRDPELGAFSCQEARKAWLDRHGNLDEAVEECVRARRRKVPLCCGGGMGGEYQSLSGLLYVFLTALKCRCRSSSPWALSLKTGRCRHCSSMGVMWPGP